MDRAGHTRKRLTRFLSLHGINFKAISRKLRREVVRVLDQGVHILADMLLTGQGEEVNSEYRKEMSFRSKILNILVQGMKKAKRRSVEWRIIRASLFSQVSSAEGNQLISDFDEELLLNQEGGDDIETAEVVDISGSASTGDQGVGGDEDEIVSRICGRGNTTSRVRTGVDVMDISPSVEGPGEHGVNGIHVGKNAHDGHVKNSGGRSEGEVKIIADDPCESNPDEGTAPASEDGWSGNGTRANRVRTIKMGGSNIYIVRLGENGKSS